MQEVAYEEIAWPNLKLRLGLINLLTFFEDKSISFGFDFKIVNPCFAKPNVPVTKT